jgi:hypothetical protein
VTRSPLVGPITLIFDRLPAGVTLNNATGLTADGKPFITLTEITIAKHKTAKVQLDFNITSHHLLGRAIVGFNQASVVQGQFG